MGYVVEMPKLGLEMERGALLEWYVEEGGEGVCLYTARGEGAVRTEVYVGYRNEYHTAVEKAILAFMPPERRERLIGESEFEALTPNTITDGNWLREELEQIRTDGIAYNHEETMPGLVGVGAPIRDRDGTLYGAISVVGPARRMDTERLNEIAEMLRRAVNVVKVNLTSL